MPAIEAMSLGCPVIASDIDVFKEILSDISIDTKLMMGNHDNRKNCLDVFPAIQLDENGFFQSSLVCGNHKLLFLEIIIE